MGFRSLLKRALTENDNDKFYKVEIGQVFLDRNGEHAALKILNSDFYNGTHQIFELEVMTKVTAVSNHSTHPGRNHVTYLKNHFEIEGPTGKHVCMVMPLLGDSIAEKATTGHVMRIPPPTVRNIAKQMLEALDFLHSECGIIHTDLQPSNILKDDQGQSPQEIDDLVRTQSSGPEFNDPNMQFRLNDLGIACFVEQHLTDDIQSEYLRAPEVSLEAPWDPSVDIFSLGCLLYQFITGDLPFVGRPGPGVTAEQDRIALLVSTFGPIPNIVLDNAALGKEFEHQCINGHGFPVSLETLVGQSFAGDAQGMLPIDELELFCDFLRKMMASDPRERERAIGAAGSMISVYASLAKAIKLYSRSVSTNDLVRHLDLLEEVASLDSMLHDSNEILLKAKNISRTDLDLAVRTYLAATVQVTLVRQALMTHLIRLDKGYRYDRKARKAYIEITDGITSIQQNVKTLDLILALASAEDETPSRTIWETEERMPGSLIPATQQSVLDKELMSSRVYQSAFSQKCSDFHQDFDAQSIMATDSTNEIDDHTPSSISHQTLHDPKHDLSVTLGRLTIDEAFGLAEWFARLLDPQQATKPPAYSRDPTF
ncbi:serine protein kinase Sky1 [Aureobasidium sp. EXF-10728]|nr:serine protein kinase Sky1 [Aureobasidium sp. EXF-10728]